MKPAVLLTCEHAAHAVPPSLRRRFRGVGGVLRSHRGWDPGAAAIARELAAELKAPLLRGRWSRLVADLNRSPDHPRVFSSFTRALPAAERARLLARWHAPYRARAAVLAGRAAGRGLALHLSIHSFTPVLRGERRPMHVALLYDPRRPGERALALALRRALRRLRPGLKCALNRPYSGRADGLTTALRRRFSPRAYLGMEIETRQDLLRSPARARAWARLYAAALRAALAATPLSAGGRG